jgi:hypothetical protein
MKMKKVSQELYDAHPSTKEWRAAPLTDGFINGFKHPFTAEEAAEDGTYVKARIATESMVIAAKAMGWENFINASEEMLSWGFSQSAKDAKAWTGVKLSDMFSACELVSSMFFLMNFKDHQITEYDMEHVEGFSPTCKMCDVTKNLGMLEDAGEMHLWCDFYYNFFVKQLNPSFRITFTHCLCNGDPECKFVVYKENQDK